MDSSKDGHGEFLSYESVVDYLCMDPNVSGQRDIHEDVMVLEYL